jgi:predicted phage baseplate assembly protein
MIRYCRNAAHWPYTRAEPEIMLPPCCPCDLLVHPPPPDIPPGLDTIVRQWAGFVEYRRAMLAEIPTYAALAAWRARGGNDLGIMLLEMWAYVLDVVGFYDARLAEESYIRTAKLPLSAQRHVQLLGYRPKPAVSASATLALLADGADPVVLPAGTAVRSDAFGDEPPQIFETGVETTIWPQRNSWRLAPLRGSLFDGRLLFAQNRARLAVGQIAVLAHGTSQLAARVAALVPEPALDGATYVRAELDPAPAALIGAPLVDVAITVPARRANPNPFGANPVTGSGTTISITLDGVYVQLHANDQVVAEIAGALFTGSVSSLLIDNVLVPVQTASDALSLTSETIALDTTPQPTMPATRVTLALATAAPADWFDNFLLRFGGVDGGSATTPAKTRIGLDDLTSAAPLEGRVEPLGDAPGSDAVLAKGMQAEGPQIAGTISIDAAGNGAFTAAAGATTFALLRTPVDLYGNLVDATRGERVANEILGSADATQAFQSFTLKKKPLSYVLDIGAPDGVRATLELRVNGILWREVPSFFDAGPTDEIYILRRDPDDIVRVMFGDGIRGARPASGVGNITADYRFGAGAAKPPAGTISQIARPVKGLKTVVNPLPASGGADAEGPDQLRTAAPRSALTLGRAVSVDDFEALARGFPGVINAAAAWAFDGRLQRASVKVWIIADAGDPSADLRANLRANADPQVPIVVGLATPQPLALSVALEIDNRFDTETVRAACSAALVDPVAGLLAPANVQIGRTLFRSEIAARLFGADGVLGATLLLGGAPAPVALLPGEGNYPDASGLVVE